MLVKRIFDVTAALVSILILLPLLPIIAVRKPVYRRLLKQ